jgi:hypothetical protein
MKISRQVVRADASAGALSLVPSVRFLSAVAAATHGKLLIGLDCDRGEPHFASWNQLDGWLRQVEALRAAA